MTNIEEGTKMKKTPDFYICSVCHTSNQFDYFVVHESSQYYLGTRCPRERCLHVDEFKAVPYRIAAEYIPEKYSN